MRTVHIITETGESAQVAADVARHLAQVGKARIVDAPPEPVAEPEPVVEEPPATSRRRGRRDADPDPKSA
jgi:hypothetical protein